MTKEELEKITHNSVIWVVKHTKYSMYQVLRTMSIIDKYGDKARYHMSNKQKEIFKFLETAIEVQLIGRRLEEIEAEKEKEND